MNLQMDIVSRLKEFINHQSVAITQFADTCKIPRPTLSQLLNGRNKKVSDELISKIHAAYPQLSVLWLMFGEGEMIHKEYIEISERENKGIFGFDNHMPMDKEDATPQIDFEKNFTTTSSISSNELEGGIPGLNSIPLTLNASSESASAVDGGGIAFHTYEKKRIVNIIVYYSDNSFESFVPGHRK